MSQLKFRSDDTIKWKYGFGNGKAGASYVAPANEGGGGTVSTTTFNLVSAGSFANDMLVLIHQSRGTGYGNYMLNKIIAGGGTTTLTLENPLDQNYVSSGSQVAQIIELKQYKNLYITSTITPTAFNGVKGGIIAFLNQKTLSGSGGTLNLAGSMGALSTGSSYSGGAVGGGFRGGNTKHQTSGYTAYQGEGVNGAGTTSTGANGNGGGGGSISAGVAGGGSGAGGVVGGTSTADASTPGTRGSAVGNAELTNINFGGGSGGGARNTNNPSGAGSSGGGIGFIFSEFFDFTGLTVNLNGGAGRSASGGPGAGAGGGSCLIKCVTGVLGTNKMTATGGASATNTDGKPASGGVGGVGILAVDYSGDVPTGTTNPTINTRFDATIKPIKKGGGLLYNFI